MHEEQADGFVFTGVRPCFFLIIQAKYRESTGPPPRRRIGGAGKKTRRSFPATQVGLPDLRIKKPISGRPEIGAQFQLWIFSYTIFARLAKNELSRLFNASQCKRPSIAATPHTVKLERDLVTSNLPFRDSI